LKDFVWNYGNDAYPYELLTEGDAASLLFCILKNRMKDTKFSTFKIHSELRPFIEEENKHKVIKRKGAEWEWAEHEPENSGAVVDIVIIDSDQEYEKTACEKSDGKYWRIVSYPLEAFHACIEVKIRVSGNIRNIEKDISKLCKIREHNKQCLVYLTVVDRKAKPGDIEKIKRKCLKRGLSDEFFSKSSM
jgi:hypothetical protein